MNFTREPIIETIITPKDGCKLLVKSSKNESQEEYIVDAVEVVSFGQALFFRSTENPKPFLVPVGDYEVVETKEARVVLKNASFERTIKIGGGREAPIRREAANKQEEETTPTDEEKEEGQSFDRKRDRRRHRNRRRSSEERESSNSNSVGDTKSQEIEIPLEETAVAKSKEEKNPPSFTALIPPPKTLIADSIKKYKDMQSDVSSSPIKIEEPKDEGDPNTVSRTAMTPSSEALQTTSTLFSTIANWAGF